MFSSAKKILCLCIFFFFVSQPFADENVDVHDNSWISIFLQPGISFLSFDQREYFQDAIDTIYHEFLLQSLDKTDSQNVAKQDFQKVNFCFPLYAGLQFQPRQDHFLSVGAGFIYDNESVVLTDQNNRSHNYSYTIQGIPLFLEYRFAIPVNLMTMNNESLFSFALRWYWALPHTEIYTSWGKLAAETPYYGAGFGFSVGYLLFNWKNMYVYGDIGYSSISVKSKKTYADIVPEGPKEKAKWNTGGIQFQIRVSFGAWNKPVVEQDTSARDSVVIKKDNIEKDSTEKDSIAVQNNPMTDAPAKEQPATAAPKAEEPMLPTEQAVQNVEAKPSTPARPSAEERPNVEKRPAAEERPSATPRPE